MSDGWRTCIPTRRHLVRKGQALQMETAMAQFMQRQLLSWSWVSVSHQPGSLPGSAQAGNISVFGKIIGS